MGRNKRNKRKKSDDSANNGPSEKREKVCTSPNAYEINISEILSEANSVLYNSDDNQEELCFENSLDLGQGHRGQSKSIFSMESQSVNESNPSNADIMQSLVAINNKLTVMDQRSHTAIDKLEKLEKKVDNFDSEIKKLWLFVQDNVTKTNDRLSKVEEMVDSTDFSLNNTTDKIVQLQKDNDVLKNELVYLQSQSMRNNLLFGGIEEAPTETLDDQENTIRNFLTEKMKIASDIVNDMKFERVHRVGQKRQNKGRDIVVKFNYFKDREMVRRQWKTLAGTQFFVYEQFPKEVNDVRKRLLPRLKRERQNGNKAWLVYDKLYVNGKPVSDK